MVFHRLLQALIPAGLCNFVGRAGRGRRALPRRVIQNFLLP